MLCSFNLISAKETTNSAEQHTLDRQIEELLKEVESTSQFPNLPIEYTYALNNLLNCHRKALNLNEEKVTPTFLYAVIESFRDRNKVSLGTPEADAIFAMDIVRIKIDLHSCKAGIPTEEHDKLRSELLKAHAQKSSSTMITSAYRWIKSSLWWTVKAGTLLGAAFYPLQFTAKWINSAWDAEEAKEASGQQRKTTDQTPRPRSASKKSDTPPDSMGLGSPTEAAARPAPVQTSLLEELANGAAAPKNKRRSPSTTILEPVSVAQACAKEEKKPTAIAWNQYEKAIISELVHLIDILLNAGLLEDEATRPLLNPIILTDTEILALLGTLLENPATEAFQGEINFMIERIKASKPKRA